MDEGALTCVSDQVGAFFYDHLGGRKILPATSTLDLRVSPEVAPLKAAYTRAFEYSDCWIDDARLAAQQAGIKRQRMRSRILTVGCKSVGPRFQKRPPVHIDLRYCVQRAARE
jgi:hypothetical protein